MKKTVSLNGIWNFLPDLDPKYHAIHGGFQNTDANRRHWLKVPVPGVWQKYAERYDIYEGVCWFHRTFTLEKPDENTVVKLRFGAVNYLCHVFINGTEVGMHETGYTEFSFPITDYLQDGENQIAVQVDNRAAITKWPPCLGYFNYGGIHRNVQLEISTGPSLDTVRITAQYCGGGKGKLGIRGNVLNTQNGLEIKALIAGNTYGAPVKNGSFELKDLFLDNIVSWSPENPKLYDLKLFLVKQEDSFDTQEIRVGFKKIDVKNNIVNLNDEPCKLKGICYVYDSPVNGLVMTKEELENDIKLMKELGCNAVRCHYPMDALFYTLCDKHGLLVWIEPPVYCYHPGDNEENTFFSDPEWSKLAGDMLREMIQTAVNHPCVSIYGIGNECNTENPEAEAFFRKLAQIIHEIDPSRLTSYAALYGIVGAIADIVDVLGINSYWGWYDKIFGGKGLAPDKAWGTITHENLQQEPIDLTPMRKMLDTVLAKKQDLALLLTEFGADSVPGHYSASRDLWSENYHADLLAKIIELAKEYPQITGTFPFCFADYRDPSKVHNGYWNERNLKGVVDENRNKKMAFNALRLS